MVWGIVGVVLPTAFFGVIAAFAIRAIRKERRLPLWPIVTSVLLGLLFFLLNWDWS